MFIRIRLLRGAAYTPETWKSSVGTIEVEIITLRSISVCLYLKTLSDMCLEMLHHHRITPTCQGKGMFIRF